MAVNIDYGLGSRQAAISGWVGAEKGKANAQSEAAARKRKKARQQRKGLMTAALHGAAAVATGGASIPYSMKYGSMANKALMGDDYEGSTMQSAQGLGSMVYAGAQQEKQKGLAQMEASHNGQLDSIYKAIDALPPGQTMERSRLANQAANLTTQFHKRFKATEAEPVWKYASSERDRLQAKTLGSVADEGQRAYEAEYGSQGRLALGPDSGKVEAASGKQVVSPEYWKKYGTISQAQEQSPVSMPSGGGHDWTKPEEEPKLLEHPLFKREDMLARKSGKGMIDLTDKRKPWETRYSEGDVWMQ